MKFNRTYSLKEISEIISCKYVGDDNFPVLGMNEIHVVEPGDIVFVDHPKYYDKALHSKATIVLINKEVECPEGKALLISDDPFRDFNKLTKHFNPFQPAAPNTEENRLRGWKRMVLQVDELWLEINMTQFKSIMNFWKRLNQSTILKRA